MSRPAVCSVPGCPVLVDGKGRCGGTCHAGCEKRAQVRPTITEQGYGARWRASRDGFVKANPLCRGVDGRHHANCDGLARVADHAPATRRELVAAGVADPDAWCYLQPLSRPCHGLKTALYDGAWGNKRRVRNLCGIEETA